MRGSWGEGWGSSGDCRADEKWDQVCGWMGQSGDEEMRERPGGTGRLVEDSTEGTWEKRLRSNQGTIISQLLYYNKNDYEKINPLRRASGYLS